MKETFSNNQFDSFGRATIVPSMTKFGRGGGNTGNKKKRKRTNRNRGNSGVKLVKGRAVLRVPGYQGVQRLTPSHLIQHINKIKELSNFHTTFVISQNLISKGFRDTIKSKIQNINLDFLDRDDLIKLIDEVIASVVRPIHIKYKTYKEVLDIFYEVFL